MNLWNRFRDGLKRTRDRLGAGLGVALGITGPVDAATRASLEEALLAADVGPATTERLIATAEQMLPPGLDLRYALERAATERLSARRATFEPGPNSRVALIVGGAAGETTLAGKLAAHSRAPAGDFCWSRARRPRRGGRAIGSVGVARGVEHPRGRRRRSGRRRADGLMARVRRGVRGRARGYRGPALHGQIDGRAREDREASAACSRSAAPRAAAPDGMLGQNGVAQAREFQRLSGG
jgi:hypothetical protein